MISHGEYEHRHHPRYTYLRWATFYILIIIAIGIALAFYAQTLHTMRVPQGGIVLTVPYKTYVVGEPITFTVTNHYDSTVYFPNHCPEEPLAVYRQDPTSKQWQRIHATTQKACDSGSRRYELAPGESRSGSYTEWTELFATPGVYRIAAAVDYVNAISYQDFTIIAKPDIASTTPATQTPSSSTSPPTSTTPAPSTTQQQPAPTTPAQTTTKTIRTNSGSVMVTYTSSGITAVSVTPNSGCAYEKGGSQTVEVTFKCAGRETQLQLSVVNGQLVQKIE